MTDAVAEYERRTGRRAALDAMPGLLLAVSAEVQRWGNEMAIESTGARDRGDPVPPWPPLPGWCREGLRIAARLGAHRGKPILKALEDIPGEILVEICASQPLPSLRSFFELSDAMPSRDPERIETALRAALEASVRFAGGGQMSEIDPPWSVVRIALREAARMAASLRSAAESQPRRPGRPGEDSLYGFYRGTVLWLQMRGVTPRPSLVALLAAACGIESLENGLDALTTRWRDRDRLWREEIRADWAAIQGGNNAA